MRAIGGERLLAARHIANREDRAAIAVFQCVLHESDGGVDGVMHRVRHARGRIEQQRNRNRLIERFPELHDLSDGVVVHDAEE